MFWHVQNDYVGKLTLKNLIMQSIQIKINGMTCMGCVNSVETVLEKISGVNSVDVSLDKALAIIQYDAEKASTDQLKQAIQDAGFEVVDS